MSSIAAHDLLRHTLQILNDDRHLNLNPLSLFVSRKTPPNPMRPIHPPTPVVHQDTPFTLSSIGVVAEWSNAIDLKSISLGSVGSNPAHVEMKILSFCLFFAAASNTHLLGDIAIPTTASHICIFHSD